MLAISMGIAATDNVVRLSGDLTARSSGALRRVLDQLPDRGSLMVDCTKVTDVDRPGFGALLSLLVRARRSAPVRVRATPGLEKLLHAEGIDRLVTVSPLGR